MSIYFQILPTRGIVYVHYSGTLLVAETARAFGEYARHPDFAPGHRQLVNLAEVTGYERDYPSILGLQMRKAEVFLKEGTQTLMVYYAPSKTALSLANLIVRSWETVPGTHPRIVTTSEADALHLLGEPGTCFADLLGRASSDASRAQN